jgi:hypothetical protein
MYPPRLRTVLFIRYVMNKIYPVGIHDNLLGAQKERAFVAGIFYRRWVGPTSILDILSLRDAS